MEQEKKSNSLLTILLIILALVIVAGAGVWYYLNQQSKAQTALLNSQVKNLETKVSDLSKTPTPTATSPVATPAEPAKVEPTAPTSTAWKTFTDDANFLSFNYPGNWTATKVMYDYIIANNKSCITEMTDQCQVINIHDAISGSGEEQAKTQENILIKDSYYIKDTIQSANIAVKTYFSNAKNNFEAYFSADCNGKGTDGSEYHLTVNTGSTADKTATIEIAKKLLETVAIAPHCP